MGAESGKPDLDRGVLLADRRRADRGEHRRGADARAEDVDVRRAREEREAGVVDRVGLEPGDVVGPRIAGGLRAEGLVDDVRVVTERGRRTHVELDRRRGPERAAVEGPLHRGGRVADLGRADRPERAGRLAVVRELPRAAVGRGAEQSGASAEVGREGVGLGPLAGTGVGIGGVDRPGAGRRLAGRGGVRRPGFRRNDEDVVGGVGRARGRHVVRRVQVVVGAVVAVAVARGVFRIEPRIAEVAVVEVGVRRLAEVAARVADDRAVFEPPAVRQHLVVGAGAGGFVAHDHAAAELHPAHHERLHVLVALEQAVLDEEVVVLRGRSGARPGDDGEVLPGRAETRGSAVAVAFRAVGAGEHEAVQHRALRAEDEHRRVVGLRRLVADFAREDGPVLDPVALGALRLDAGEATVEFGAGGQDEARLAVGAGRGFVGPLGDPNFGTGRDRGEGRGERRPGVRPGRTVARAGGVRVDVVADRDDEVLVLDERAGGDRGNGVLRGLGRHGALAGRGFRDAAPARSDLKRVVSVGVGRRDGGSVAGRDAKARDREAVRVRHAAADRALGGVEGDQVDAPAVADHVHGAFAHRDGNRLERVAGRGGRDRNRRGARDPDVGPDALRVARRRPDRGAAGALDRHRHAGERSAVRAEDAARDDFAGLLREDVEDGGLEVVAAPIVEEVPAVGRTAPAEVHVVVEGAILESVAVEDDLVLDGTGVDGIAGVEVRAEHVRDRRVVEGPAEGARVLERAGDDVRALVGAGAAAGVARAVEDADVEEQRAAGLALRVVRRRIGRHRVPLVGSAVAVAAARGERRPRRRPVRRDGDRVRDPADAGLRPLVVVHDLAERGLHAAADEVARRVVVLAVAALRPPDVA